jgi:aryl-alcohol dehydrogenase-like predicted oxidoreductase
MKYFEKRGTRLPLFTLGTVQLGMNYGLGDFTAKPSEDYAHSMLTRANELGVTALDTANNYGDSEKVIGSWLAKGGYKNEPYVITKIAPFDHSSEKALRDSMIRQMDGCLKTLGVEKIDMMMIHNYQDYIRDKEIVKDMMARFKAEGKIDKTAISVYSVDDYSEVARSGFDAVQIPINMFDWGKIEDGGIEELHRAGMIVFAILIIETLFSVISNIAAASLRKEYNRI